MWSNCKKEENELKTLLGFETVIFYSINTNELDHLIIFKGKVKRVGWICYREQAYEVMSYVHKVGRTNATGYTSVLM
jgi:hypothetical protein